MFEPGSTRLNPTNGSDGNEGKTEPDAVPSRKKAANPGSPGAGGWTGRGGAEPLTDLDLRTTTLSTQVSAELARDFRRAAPVFKAARWPGREAAKAAGHAKDAPRRRG